MANQAEDAAEQPMSSWVKTEVSARRIDVCLALMSGHRQAAPAYPESAFTGSQLIS